MNKSECLLIFKEFLYIDERIFKILLYIPRLHLESLLSFHSGSRGHGVNKLKYILHKDAMDEFDQLQTCNS